MIAILANLSNKICFDKLKCGIEYLVSYPISDLLKKAPNGRIYYFNKHTQKSVWEKPESLMTAGEKHLANCPWKSHKNTDGKTYFYNAVTKASSWQEPDELKKGLVEYY